MLAYFFPPSEAVAAHRPAGLYRHLAAYGWEPIFITAEREGTPPGIIQTPDGSWMRRVEEARQRGFAGNPLLKPELRRGTGRLRPLIGAAKGLLRLFPPWHDEYTGWSYRLIARAIEEGRQRGVDLVWATCNPFTLAPAALQIARALKVPCIVDLRDALPEYLAIPRGTRHWFYRAMRQVDAVTVSAPSNANPELLSIRARQPIYHILSGSWLPGPVPASASPQFRLLHAGLLYGGKRNPAPLLRACAQLAREVPDFRRDARICFMGRDAACVTAIPEYGEVAEMCELPGPRPAAELQPMLAESSVLLIINGEEFELSDTVPAKLYELLAFDAPILSIGGAGGIQADLLAWCGCGRWTNAPAEIVDFLRAGYLRWKAEGLLTAPRNRAATAYLTQARMAAETAGVFSAVVEGRPVPCHPRPPWQGA
ncbi:MAG: glycosyltransferase family protein [Armatimonadota bacterium]